MLEQYEDVLTIEDLKEILNIGKGSVYDLLNMGVIPALRIGRNWKIPKAAVIEYLNSWRNNYSKK